MRFHAAFERHERFYSASSPGHAEYFEVNIFDPDRRKASLGKISRFCVSFEYENRARGTKIVNRKLRAASRRFAEAQAQGENISETYAYT